MLLLLAGINSDKPGGLKSTGFGFLGVIMSLGFRVYEFLPDAVSFLESLRNASLRAETLGIEIRKIPRTPQPSSPKATTQPCKIPGSAPVPFCPFLVEFPYKNRIV